MENETTGNEIIGNEPLVKKNIYTDLENPDKKKKKNLILFYLTNIFTYIWFEKKIN
jgi:hypothetical protein